MGSGRGSESPGRSDKGQGMRRGKGSERIVCGQRVETACRASSVFSLLVEYTFLSGEELVTHSTLLRT